MLSIGLFTPIHSQSTLLHHFWCVGGMTMLSSFNFGRTFTPAVMDFWYEVEQIASSINKVKGMAAQKYLAIYRQRIYSTSPL